ncbi:hypothetical protein K2173_020404 [Erythroxylum novogranatense]|uniref:RNase H type-1 domain-containing protein n=1 Tax=Erythroxylum novogranatense TaxID=1862640 RepID=A0AAV8TIX3_9ROSI|nr:hypothetical protein K2173_020404 [Erythroxylum novogranatense]
MTRFFNDADLSLVLCVCWAIWNSQNSVIWSNRFKTPVETWFAAKRTLDDWQNTQEKAPQAVKQARVRKWQPPDHGWIKVNINAATQVNGEFTGVALVVRDDRGSFLAARNNYVIGSLSPKVAEAMAIKEALSWIQDKSWDHVVCESDSLEVVQAIQASSYEDFTSFGAMIDNIKQNIESWSGVCRVSAVPRSANTAAHVLAQATRHSDCIGEWSLVL